MKRFLAFSSVSQLGCIMLGVYAFNGTGVTGGVFPWDTFVINSVGCLGIGLIAGVLDRGALVPPQLRMALMVGFLGGFTTFSTFALDAFRLAAAREWLAAGGYVLFTNGVGLAATWAGTRPRLG
jgi:CrcB protein